MRIHAFARRALLAACALLPSLLGAQEGSGGRDERDLIVLVRGEVTTSAGDTIPVRGSGIIVAMARDSFFVATARHVARPSDGAASTNLRVSPGRGGPGRPATLAHFDTAADLAVLAVPMDRGWPGALPFPLSWAGDPDALQPRQPLHPLGCPQGNVCETPGAPSHFWALDGADLRFESPNVVPGYSGGGLFTARGELVGMIQSVAHPNFTAMRVDTLLARVAAWGVPVQMLPVPRDPFARMVTVGASVAAVHTGLRGSTASVFVERTARWTGNVHHLLALRAGLGGPRSSVGLHGGAGVHLPVGRRLRDLGSTGAFGAFVDAGVEFVAVEAVTSTGAGPREQSLGWSAGGGIRVSTVMERVILGGLVEVRFMDTSFSGQPRDAVSLGLTLGVPY